MGKEDILDFKEVGRGGEGKGRKRGRAKRKEGMEDSRMKRSKRTQ